jgi:serine protease
LSNKLVSIVGAVALAGLWSLSGGVQARQATAEPQVVATAPADADVARVQAITRALRENLDHVPGEVLVKFRAGTEPAVQSAVFRLAPRDARGGGVRWVGAMAVLSIDPGAPAAQVAWRLALEPEVEYAQPNYLIRLDSTPNDPGLSRQWNFTAIDLPRAWDINPGGRDVLVAVVDSGITDTTTGVNYRLWTGRGFEVVPVPYRVNPDLSESRIQRGLDTTGIRLVIPGFPPGQPVFDTQGHGTHVAGTILQSTNNNLGFAGVAYEARLLPVKSCISYWDLQFYLGAVGEPGFVPPSFGGGCATSDVVAGIRYAADQGAKVINLSLGGPGESPAHRDALNYAVQRGAFVAIAVGNEFEEGNPVEYPAAYAAEIAGAMSVASIGQSQRRAYYSNTGSHVEIAAPGGDVRDGGLTGLIFQLGLFGPDFNPATVITPRFDRYADEPNQGTSMAAPHVAGLAALLYSQGVTNPAAIEAAIKRFARDLGAAGNDPEFGHGLIDARATLRGLGLAR